MKSDLEDIVADYNTSQPNVTSWRCLLSTYKSDSTPGSIEELRQLKQSLLDYRTRLEAPTTPPRLEAEFVKTPQPKEKRRKMTESYRAIMQQMTEARGHITNCDNPDEIIHLAQKSAGKVNDLQEVPANVAGEVLRRLIGDLSLKSVAKFVYNSNSRSPTEVKRLQKSLADCEQQVSIMRDVVKESCNLMSDMSAKWAKDRQEANALRHQLSTASTKGSETEEVVVLKTALLESERRLHEVASLLKKTQPRQAITANQQTQADLQDLEHENIKLKQQLKDNMRALDAVSEAIEENAMLKELLEDREVEIEKLKVQTAAVQSVIKKLGPVKLSS